VQQAIHENGLMSKPECKGTLLEKTGKKGMKFDMFATLQPYVKLKSQ
jgi:hypothetical protein